MQLRITARHFDLTPEVRERANDAFDHLTKFYDRIVAADLFITMEKNRYHAEFKLSVSKDVITAGSESHDLHAAIDQCAEKVKTQLVRYKDKLKEKKPEEITGLSAALARPNSDEDEIDI